MQGIFVGVRRAPSKKAVKEAIAAGEPVALQATSMFGNEYDGPVVDAPDGSYFFVGPCPNTNRKYYGKIVKAGASIKVS